MATLTRWLLIAIWCSWLPAADTVQHPFRGVTYIERVETAPRALRMHIVKIDLAAPGIAFKLSPPGGKLETVRQTTLEFLLQEHAQIAVNAHYFLPWPSSSPEASLVGFAASNGTVYSAFADGKHILEPVKVWNAVAGSAQIVTGGVKTIPASDPLGVLHPRRTRRVFQRQILVRADQRSLGDRHFEGWRHAGAVHRGRPRRQRRHVGGRSGGRSDPGLRRGPGAQPGWRRIHHAGHRWQNRERVFGQPRRAQGGQQSCGIRGAIGGTRRSLMPPATCRSSRCLPIRARRTTPAETPPACECAAGPPPFLCRRGMRAGTCGPAADGVPTLRKACRRAPATPENPGADWRRLRLAARLRPRSDRTIDSWRRPAAAPATLRSAGRRPAGTPLR